MQPWTEALLKRLSSGSGHAGQWQHHMHVITFNKGIERHSTRIELFYFDDNFHRIVLMVSY